MQTLFKMLLTNKNVHLNYFYSAFPRVSAAIFSLYFETLRERLRFTTAGREQDDNFGPSLNKMPKGAMVPLLRDTTITEPNMNVFANFRSIFLMNIFLSSARAYELHTLQRVKI